jgi:putative transposase
MALSQRRASLARTAVRQTPSKENNLFTAVTCDRKAFSRLDPSERPMLHSDQGWQYRMPAFRWRLQTSGLVQSMSRKGNCLDNAAMESFFGMLKCELFYLNKYKSVQDLKEALHDYIHYYNVDRIKLGLRGLSPVAYRLRAEARAA